MPRVEVRVEFEFPATESLPSYRDALFIPLDDYNAMSEDELTAAKQARYDAWADLVLNPPPAPEPEPVPVDDVLAQAADALAQAAAAVEAARAAQQEPSPPEGQ